MDKNLFIKALREALENAKKFANTEDGGTCNFDTCEFYAKGMRLSVLEGIVKEASQELRVSKWGTGRFHIGGYECGQANRRTEMVEAFEKTLRNYGFDTGVYYAMD